VTCARCVHYVFNPVSVFYCLRADGSLRCAIAEVRNTYREKHLYVLDEPLPAPRGVLAHYRVKKDFFVSPFNTLQGEYEFHLSPLDGKLDLRVNLVHEGQPIIVTRVTGTGAPITTGRLARTLLRHPFDAALALPRIWGQAWRLRHRHKLKDQTT
jgi:DUF1365 family protein